ncbi:MAG TPA: ATP synthase F1 subunit delta [bacterium]|nr:ATP synthase F1 subunit delta [bacterium]
MLASLISERYAKALLRAAQAENALDAVGAQARGLELALRAAGGADRFLADPVAMAADKLAVIEGAFEGGMHPLFKAFVKAVLHQKRERFLPRILGNFGTLLDEAEGRVEAKLGTARSLPAEERAMLESALSKRLGRQVTLKPYSDKALLGGAILRIGDTVYDASLRGRLSRLGRLLAEGPPPRPKRAPAPAAGGAKKKAEGKASSSRKAATKKAAGAKQAQPSKKTVTSIKAKAPAKKKAVAKKKKAAKKR